jgi:hypothetical protein
VEIPDRRVAGFSLEVPVLAVELRRPRPETAVFLLVRLGGR